MNNVEELEEKIKNIFKSLYPHNKKNEECELKNINFIEFKLDSEEKNIYSFKFNAEYNIRGMNNEHKQDVTVTGKVRRWEVEHENHIKVTFDESKVFSSLGVDEEIKYYNEDVDSRN
ncbi:MAG: hypothetical protein J6K42_01710 [Clostridia bacterium]|nr:hypothetical protein [Clostridia bacterium]